jgi:hypothetical protein
MASSISAGTTSSTALVATADTTGALQLATNNGTVAVTIDTSQRVGIGTTTLNGKLNVLTATDSKLIFNDGSTTGNVRLEAVNNAYSGYKPFETNGSVQIFATGGTERMRIDSAGYVTTPNQPCFSAYSSANIASGNAWTGWSVSVNIGSHFNVTTGVFTAPIAGTYLFSAQGLANGADSFEVFPRKNNTQIGSGTAIRVANGGNAGGGSTVFYLTLAANDTVDLYVNQGPTNTNGNFNGFSGRLVS